MADDANLRDLERLVFWLVTFLTAIPSMTSFSGLAVRQISGAQAHDQCGADVIAGLRERSGGRDLLHKARLLRIATRARDMRRVSFLGAVN